MQKMIGRRQLRLAAINALESANLEVNGDSVTVISPGDWSLTPELLPAIQVRTDHEIKSSFNRGAPEFTTTCSLELKVTVAGDSAESVQDDIETLWEKIESAIFGNYSIISMVQQFSSVESALDIKADGQRHLAGIAAAFRAEFPEMYEPTQILKFES